MKIQKYLIPILISLIIGCSLKQEQSETKANVRKSLDEALEITQTKANSTKATSKAVINGIGDINNRSLEEALATIPVSQRLKDEKRYASQMINFERLDYQAPNALNDMYSFFQQNSKKLSDNQIKSLVDIVKDKDNSTRAEAMNSFSKSFFQSIKAKYTTFENLHSLTWKSYEEGLQRITQHSKSAAEIKLLTKVSLKTQAVAYLKYYYGIWEYVSPQENPQLANEIKETVLKNLNEKYVANLKKNKIDTSWLVGPGSLSEKLFSN